MHGNMEIVCDSKLEPLKGEIKYFCHFVVSNYLTLINFRFQTINLKVN
jgi:hypothetical protein